MGEPAAAAAAIEPVLEHVSWYLCGADEAVAAADCAAASSVSRTAGSATVIADGERIEVPPARREAVVDEVGAGDAFAAGFAFGLLQGWHAARLRPQPPTRSPPGRCAGPATGRRCRGSTRCATCSAWANVNCGWVGKRRSRPR